MTIIKLQSKDGVIVDTDLKHTKCSKTICNLLKHLGMENGGDQIVPLPEVSSAILKKVLQWIIYHKNDPDQDDEFEENQTDDKSSWDADFVKVDQDTLFELVLAANYLAIKELLDLVCNEVGNIVKGKSPKEIRQIFKLKKVDSSKTEEQVKKK